MDWHFGLESEFYFGYLFLFRCILIFKSDITKNQIESDLGDPNAEAVSLD